MDPLFHEYRRQLARWPVASAREREIGFAVEGEHGTLAVADWLGHWRTDNEGKLARVLLETSELVEGRTRRYRYAKLVAPWVQHLAANLDGQQVSTVIVSKKGTVEFPSLKEGEAATRLGALLRAWEAGMRRPLPLAVESGFEWIFAGGAPRRDAQTPHDLSDARKAARRKYEGDGGGFVTGEVEKSASLRRAYPDFDGLSASGEFAVLADTLLKPLIDAVKNNAGADE
ncbi:hypothetical protein PPGU19_092680 (plasmid) [Paraburkholderia sp. PGU19]|nr:hypothetical protein PPGU19_092680 [Paraburkholderia sp. PGU19]